MTLVSYIIPCFNCSKYIIDCVDSVLAQTEIDIEIIIVDDGSVDNSVDVVHDYIHRRPSSSISFFRHPGGANKGVSSSRRLGFTRSRGDYICFLDSDDYILDKLKSSKQLAAFASDSSLAVVHTAVSTVGIGLDKSSYDQNFSANCRYDSYSFSGLKDCFSANHVCNSTVMIRRDALERVAFDSWQCFQYEDWALWLLISRFGRFRCLPQRTVAYRLHESSSTFLVQKHHLRHCYSLIEFKLIVLVRSGLSILALRVIMSLRSDVLDLLRTYTFEGVSGRPVRGCGSKIPYVFEALFMPDVFIYKLIAKCRLRVGLIFSGLLARCRPRS